MFRKPTFFLLILLFSCSFCFTNTLTAAPEAPIPEQTTYTTGDVISTLPSSGFWYSGVKSDRDGVEQSGIGHPGEPIE